jgi:DNA primase
MFPSSLLQEIKDRLSIVAVVGESVPLKQAGRNFKGLCPFHGEKSPSFMVSDDKQIFHCFGCGEGGDVFRYVMKREGLNFPEAVRTLADRAGVRLPEELSHLSKPEEDALQKKKRWALRTNQVVAEYFHQNLLHEARGQEARKYLKERGFQDSSLFTQHFLGFADDSWDELVRYLTTKKVPLSLAAELGLIRPRSSGDGYYDFYRQRIIFPITNAKGEILGFGGRTFGAAKTAEGQDAPAKYLNSPDSFIYHKSHSVFGLNVALPAIRQEDAVWVVEGYLDAVALHQAGIGHVVAPLGTALTSGHLRLLTRFSRNIWLIFDGDAAGANAARRSWPLFLEQGLMPKVVILPNGEDPDTFVRKSGAEAMHKLAAEALTLGEWVVDRVVLEAGPGASAAVIVMRELKPLLKQVHDPVELALYLRRMAQRLAVDESVLRASLTDKKEMRVATSAVKRADIWESRSIERRILRLVLQFPMVWPDVKDQMVQGLFEDATSRTVLQALIDNASEEGLSIGRLVENLVDKELCGMVEEMSLSEPECGEEEVVAVIRAYLDVLERRHHKGQLHQLNQEIAEAQLSGNESRLMELLTQKQNLVRNSTWQRPMPAKPN